MSYYRNFSPNPNSTDATLTSPTPSLNDLSSKFYDNNIINQTDNLKMTSSVSNTITNTTTNNNNDNNVFLTLKFAYSPIGELVIDMEPTNTNSSDIALSNQQWVHFCFIIKY